MFLLGNKQININKKCFLLAEQICQIQACFVFTTACFVLLHNKRQWEDHRRRGGRRGITEKGARSVCQAAWAPTYDGWAVLHHSPGRRLTAHNGSEINKEAEHFHQLPLHLSIQALIAAAPPSLHSTLQQFARDRFSSLGASSVPT